MAKVEVIFFAGMKSFFPQKLENIDIETTDSVNELLLRLQPECQTLLGACKIAVNGVYAQDNQILKDKDVVAILPPVSGG